MSHDQYSPQSFIYMADMPCVCPHKGDVTEFYVRDGTLVPLHYHICVRQPTPDPQLESPGPSQPHPSPAGSHDSVPIDQDFRNLPLYTISSTQETVGGATWKAHIVAMREFVSSIQSNVFLNGVYADSFLRCITYGMRETVGYVNCKLSVGQNGFVFYEPKNVKDKFPKGAEVADCIIPTQKEWVKQTLNEFKGRRYIITLIHHTGHWGACVYDSEARILVYFDAIEKRRYKRAKAAGLAWRRLLFDIGLHQDFKVVAPPLTEQPNIYGSGYISIFMLMVTIRGLKGPSLTDAVVSHGLEPLMVDGQLSTCCPPPEFELKIRDWADWTGVKGPAAYLRIKSVLVSIACNELLAADSAVESDEGPFHSISPFDPEFNPLLPGALSMDDNPEGDKASPGGRTPVDVEMKNRANVFESAPAAVDVSPVLQAKAKINELVPFHQDNILNPMIFVQNAWSPSWPTPDDRRSREQYLNAHQNCSEGTDVKPPTGENNDDNDDDTVNYICGSCRKLENAEGTLATMPASSSAQAARSAPVCNHSRATPPRGRASSCPEMRVVREVNTPLPHPMEPLQRLNVTPPIEVGRGGNPWPISLPPFDTAFPLASGWQPAEAPLGVIPEEEPVSPTTQLIIDELRPMRQVSTDAQGNMWDHGVSYAQHPYLHPGISRSQHRSVHPIISHMPHPSSHPTASYTQNPFPQPRVSYTQHSSPHPRLSYTQHPSSHPGASYMQYPSPHPGASYPQNPSFQPGVSYTQNPSFHPGVSYTQHPSLHPGAGVMNEPPHFAPETIPWRAIPSSGLPFERASRITRAARMKKDITYNPYRAREERTRRRQQDHQ